MQNHLLPKKSSYYENEYLCDPVYFDYRSSLLKAWIRIRIDTEHLLKQYSSITIYRLPTKKNKLSFCFPLQQTNESLPFGSKQTD
jgi:hypothetical protein